MADSYGDELIERAALIFQEDHEKYRELKISKKHTLYGDDASAYVYSELMRVLTEAQLDPSETPVSWNRVQSRPAKISPESPTQVHQTDHADGICVLLRGKAMPPEIFSLAASRALATPNTVPDDWDGPATV